MDGSPQGTPGLGPLAGEALLKARVMAAAAAIPSPTRPQGRRRAVTLFLASIALALAIFESAGGLAHSTGRPLSITLAIAGGWGLFSAVLSGVVLWRRRSTLGRRPAVLLLSAFATPIVLVAWLHHFQGTYEEPFPRIGWRCLGYTLAMAALPLGSFLALRRGIEPRGPWALGAAIGATCGAWAGMLVDLWCPLTNTPHVLVGHVLPIVILIAVGTALGRALLGVRPLPEAMGARSSQETKRT
jgi:hypothetical protein